MKENKFISVEEADQKILALQAMIGAGKPQIIWNSYEPFAEEGIVEREDGIVFHHDISYKSQYANGFFDVWYAPKDTAYPGQEKGRKRPTVFYFHGGGFFMGSKDTGDPLAVKKMDSLDFIGEILKHGYHFVNVNYALAPKYRFPAQMIQMNECFQYVADHAEELGLSMEDVFLKGGSAGADFSEIYGMAILDEAYAKAMGFEAVLKKEQIRGLILDEPSLCTAEFNDENMNTMFTTWLGEENLAEGTYAKLVDVPKHIKDSYFPSYLIASNKDFFFERHTAELAGVLERIKVPHVHFTVAPTKGIYDHGFAMKYQEDAIAKEAFDGMFAFMENCLE